MFSITKYLLEGARNYLILNWLFKFSKLMLCIANKVLYNCKVFKPISMKEKSKFKLNIEFLTKKVPTLVCSCERDALLTDFKMTEQDIAFRECPKCSNDPQVGWMSFYDSLTFGTKKNRVIKKYRMYARFMENAEFLKDEVCLRCGKSEGVWSYGDRWMRMPNSIFADVKVFKNGIPCCAKCATKLSASRPGNNKGEGIYADPNEVKENPEPKEYSINIKPYSFFLKKSSIEPKERKKRERRSLAEDSSPFLTATLCNYCKESKPRESFIVNRKDYGGGYFSTKCKECRTAYSVKFKTSGNLSLENEKKYRAIHEDKCANAICQICAGVKKGNIRYYRFKGFKEVKYFMKPWSIASGVYPAHFECVKEQKRKEKAMKLLQFENTILAPQSQMPATEPKKNSFDDIFD